MNQRTTPIYEFGPFRLDPAERLLARAGEPVLLPPKVFDTLVVLVENSGHVVTKDQLMKRVWPDTFVEENNLTVNISAIRRALGENYSERPYVETVPRLGYRFVAPVKEAPELAASPPEPRIARAAIRSRNGGIRGMVAALGSLAFLLVVFGIWSNRENSTVGPVTITSLAVLPLENLSHDPDQEYFADGMTEELRTQLSQIGGLRRVISRTTVMHYKATKKTLPQIAAELKVDALVEGSVLRVGEKIRITARLVLVRRGAAGEQSLWARSYHRDARDVLALHNEVARDIAREVKIQLNPREQQRLARVETVDPKAHEDYLLGQHYWNKGDAEGHLKAIDYFQEAIDRAPLYAAPYAGLADTYTDLAYFGVLVPKDGYEAARKMAMQALQLDPDLSAAHISLALVLQDYDWKWTEAEKHYKRALDLDPSYAPGHQQYAYHLATRGRFPEAIAEVEKARELDPGSLKINVSVAWIYYFARDYPRAIEGYEQALEIDPNASIAHEALAMTYERAGMPDQAFAEYQKYLSTGGVAAAQVGALAAVYRSGGMRTYLQRLLQMEEEEVRQGNRWSWRLASFFARLGDRERAFRWLETAFSERNPHLQYLGIEPAFDSLREDFRFSSLLQRLHLPRLSQPPSSRVLTETKGRP